MTGKTSHGRTRNGDGMIDAKEARRMVEDQSLLEQKDFDLAEEKTLDAIQKGRNKACWSFSIREDKQYPKMLPMRNYLRSLGYDTSFSNYTNSTVLTWMW